MTNISIKSSFEAGLNQHGHAFHHRVIHETRRIARDSQGRAWKVLAVECPIKIHGTSTRIDFILEHRVQDTVNLLVAECKRVNPGYSRWCFTKSPYQTPHWIGPQLVVEGIWKLYLDDESEVFESAGTGRNLDRKFLDRLYDIGFIIKSEEKGDAHPVSTNKDALEDACSQVCRGLNGLINAFVQDDYIREHIRRARIVRFLPAIFTTAQLWSSTVDLASTDLERGVVSIGEEPVNHKWLFYQYPQSPGLKHDIRRAAISQDSFADLIARDFIRGIAVVGPGGIPEFLSDVWLEVMT